MENTKPSCDGADRVAQVGLTTVPPNTSTGELVCHIERRAIEGGLSSRNRGCQGRKSLITCGKHGSTRKDEQYVKRSGENNKLEEGRGMVI